MQYRKLQRDELEQIWTIDRREHIANIYRLVDGKLRLEPLNVDVLGWPPDDARTYMPLLCESFERGGEFLGAFDGDRLVGLSVLDTVWRGARGDLLQLEFMHVGHDHRGKGVGVHLFEHARTVARERGARGLYISATPSENTVHFYQGRGATVIAEPDPELFALEPEDIHFECPVVAAQEGRS